jgi:hypothetical protein
MNARTRPLARALGLPLAAALLLAPAAALAKPHCGSAKVGNQRGTLCVKKRLLGSDKCTFDGADVDCLQFGPDYRDIVGLSIVVEPMGEGDPEDHSGHLPPNADRRATLHLRAGATLFVDVSATPGATATLAAVDPEGEAAPIADAGDAPLHVDLAPGDYALEIATDAEGGPLTFIVQPHP